MWWKRSGEAGGSSAPSAPVRVDAPPGVVVVLSTVQGLVSERDRVRDVVARERPRAIALGVSPESAAALLRYERQPDEDPFDELPDHDYVYSVKLREFGPVDLPPPDLVEAVRQAQARGIGVFGVDLPDEQYEEAFTTEVSAWGFLRYGRIQKRLARRPPRAADARAFSLAWDRAIRKVKGIARVEAKREAHMAAQARALAEREAGTILLVVDAPRAEGVLASLREG